MLIDSVIDDSKISNKTKEIIKYINTHEGIVDKIFLDIYNDLCNQCKSIDKSDESLTLYFDETSSNVAMDITNDCVGKHTMLNIPSNLHDNNVVVFLFRVVQLNENTIQIIRKK